MKRFWFTSITLSILTLSTLLLPGATAPASPTEQRIMDYVDAHTEEAITLLETTVNINSGTMNLEGVQETGKIFDSELASLGFVTSWIPMDSVKRAGHLVAEPHQGKFTRRRRDSAANCLPALLGKRRSPVPRTQDLGAT